MSCCGTPPAYDELDEVSRAVSQKLAAFLRTLRDNAFAVGLQEGQDAAALMAAGYAVRLPDRRTVYCAGDTNVFTDMQLIERLYHPELAFLPIGDLYTMSPREAALACRMLSVRKVIPLHF